jgi:hypothetical protein
MQHLDNKASEAFLNAIEECGMTYQLITPHVHRANIAEKAIQTFKYHFTAILSIVDDSFPVHLWDRLLSQAETTLNMLRAANAAPNVSVSAYMYTHGNHDFNAHPFAPLGCAVQLFETPEVRKSWDSHSVNDWYLGTSMEHYRNHKIYCKKTGAERILDTVWFKPAADHIVNAAASLTDALKGNLPAQVENSTSESLKKLADIFTKAAVKYSNKEAGLNARLPGVGSRTPGVQRTENTANREAQSPGVETASPGVPVSEGTRNRATRRGEVRTLVNEAILSAIEFSSVPVAARKLASRKFPLAMLCEIAGAVLDPKTGELMEYRHLMK